MIVMFCPPQWIRAILKKVVLEQFLSMGILMKHTVRTREALMVASNGGVLVAIGEPKSVFRRNQVINLIYFSINEKTDKCYDYSMQYLFQKFIIFITIFILHYFRLNHNQDMDIDGDLRRLAFNNLNIVFFFLTFIWSLNWNSQISLSVLKSVYIFN
jgi:hypothetical protein